jgi:hypothetical protein
VTGVWGSGLQPEPAQARTLRGTQLLQQSKAYLPTPCLRSLLNSLYCLALLPKSHLTSPATESHPWGKGLSQKKKGCPNFTHNIASAIPSLRMSRREKPPNPKPPFFSPIAKITCSPPPQLLRTGAGPGDARSRAPLPASKWQRGSAALHSPSEVKPQSLCPFPRDGWRSRPVAMIMRLEFDREASNRKTYGVNLDAPRLAHTRE